MLPLHMVAMEAPFGSFVVSPEQRHSHVQTQEVEGFGRTVIASTHGGDALFLKAHEEYRMGKYESASKHCGLFLESNWDRTDALILLGAIHYQLRNYNLCIANNVEALRVNPCLAECYCNIGNALRERGDIDSALQYYAMAVVVAAHVNLGNVMKVQGFTEQAYRCYVEALRYDPTFSIAWSNLGGLFVENGDYLKASNCYQEVVKLLPLQADAHLNHGNVLKVLGRDKDALASYKKAIELQPNCCLAYGNMGHLFYQQGNFEQAIKCYRQAIALNSTFVEAHNNLGNALKDSGQTSEALVCYQTCLRLQPSHPQALTNIGNIYLEASMLQEAAACYLQAVSVTTGLSSPYDSLAAIYKQEGHYPGAIICYGEVIRIQPSAADAFLNRGNLYKEMGRVSEAICDYLQAVTLQPTMAEGHSNLGSAYKDSGQVEAAIVCYKKALSLRKAFSEAICLLLHTQQAICIWEDRDKKFVELEVVIKRQLQGLESLMLFRVCGIDLSFYRMALLYMPLQSCQFVLTSETCLSISVDGSSLTKTCLLLVQQGILPSVQPFHALAYPMDPALVLQISKRYAEGAKSLALRFCSSQFKHPLAVPLNTSRDSNRLRIGYVSSDFGNHPLSHLMGSVFGLHRRANMEVFCYALTSSDGSEWRERITKEVEHFVDVSAMACDKIAKLVVSDGIHILVNLNGYTKGARNEIFALRPAPIQISYMGFPGTTGADFIDYLVTDELVSPLHLAHMYSEKLVHLPHCYFVNDYKQRNSDVLYEENIPSRATYGLPEDKFLFACFNQLYKMSPDIFTTWCNILKRVPNSVLWLLKFPGAGEPHLRAFAIKQGLKQDQILFTDVAGKSEHIRRSALADLFLDTPLCNAHTTGTDILWAGLPMVTMPLERMATRVAMSLCYAAGCGDEMVVSSLEEYEERAVFYATHPDELKSLRRKLKGNRLSCSLFDTKRWVRNLERAYHRMWEIHCEGRQPESFKVIESDHV